jgi:hypothetical protein
VDLDVEVVVGHVWSGVLRPSAFGSDDDAGEYVVEVADFIGVQMPKSELR